MSLMHEYIVAYDVESNKLRKKLSDQLKDYGLISIQKSVFWGRITHAESKAVRRMFSTLLNKETDYAFVLRANFSEQIKENGFGYGDGSQFSEVTYYVV